MTDADRIKEIGQRAGALVVGVAAADAFNDFVPDMQRRVKGSATSACVSVRWDAHLGRRNNGRKPHMGFFLSSRSFTTGTKKTCYD